jgi:hypothetical protein
MPGNSVKLDDNVVHGQESAAVAIMIGTCFLLTSSSPFAIVVVLDIWQTRTLYPYFGKYQDFRVSLRYGWCFLLRFRSMSSSPSKSRLFTRS